MDLTGERFGLLTVLYKIPKEIHTDKYNHPYWKCQCDCGNTCDVSQSHLRSGHTKSCGCWKIQATKIFNKTNKCKNNQYDLSGDYGIGYTLNIDPTDINNKRNYFYFDLDDYEKIKKYYWFFDAYGYIVAYKKEEKRGFWKLHRFVMNADDNMEVDHVKHLLYDNRKTELRLCSRSQNQQNSQMKKITKSGYKGITAVYNNKYQAHITVNKKRIHLGTFNTLEEAVAARKEAEDKYFGDFSYDNSMKLKTS